MAVRDTLEKAGFYEKISKAQLFLSVHDAVREAEEREFTSKEEVGERIISKFLDHLLRGGVVSN